MAMLDRNFSQTAHKSVLKCPVDLILVPQGAEYQAVCRGLGSATVEILPIPIGINSVREYLRSKNLGAKYSRVLLMGLCGSLSPEYKLGDALLFRDCIYGDEIKECDPILTQILYDYFQHTIPLVRGLTSDHLICSAQEKTALAQQTSADAIEMEGMAILEIFPQVTILRIVSDDCTQNLPDLNCAITPRGTLAPFSLAVAFLRQPLAAIKLIRGSLLALQKLAQIAEGLGSST